MKRLLACILVCALIFGLTSCAVAPEEEYTPSTSEYKPETLIIPLGETGATVTLPAYLGFESRESKLNEFYGVGGGLGGEWMMIANREAKADFAEYTDFTVEDFTEAAAKANNGEAGQEENGDHYFVYTNTIEDITYKFYTAVREGETHYYRIAFYCQESQWSVAEEYFSDWAATITVK